MDNKGVYLMKTHKDLDVWKRSLEFVTDIYKISRNFPKEEMYGITSQIRRSAVSIPSNISEGAARSSDKEFAHFISISLGSIAETETQLIITRNLGYISEVDFNQLEIKLTEIRKLALGLKKFINEKTY